MFWTFVVVCHLVQPHIRRMVIDEERKYILTNYEQVKRGSKATNTDHATEFLDLDLKVVTEKPERRTIWNFKHKESQNNFKIQTSETVQFSNCFKNKA